MGQIWFCQKWDMAHVYRKVDKEWILDDFRVSRVYLSRFSSWIKTYKMRWQQKKNMTHTSAGCSNGPHLRSAARSVLEPEVGHHNRKDTTSQVGGFHKWYPKWCIFTEISLGKNHPFWDSLEMLLYTPAWPSMLRTFMSKELQQAASIWKVRWAARDGDLGSLLLTSHQHLSWWCQAPWKTLKTG